MKGQHFDFESSAGVVLPAVICRPENLLKAQKTPEEHGSIDGTIHRFLLVAKK